MEQDIANRKLPILWLRGLHEGLKSDQSSHWLQREHLSTIVKTVNNNNIQDGLCDGCGK